MKNIPYDSETLDGGWKNVQDFLQEAHLIAFDGCHKIYLAMDEHEATWFRERYPHVVDGSPETMLGTLHDWFDKSCGLRFISACYHNEQDPNGGFLSLISQFAGEEEFDDEEDQEIEEDFDE